jgi:hypothetical protein
MADRLRLDGVEGYLASELRAGSNIINFDRALTQDGGGPVASLNTDEYLVLSILDSDYVLREILYLTSYEQGQTTGTVDRGQEGTTTWNHAAGSKFVHTPTSLDFIVVQEHDQDPNAHLGQIQAIADSAAANAIEGHVAEVNPHPQYVLATDTEFENGISIPPGQVLDILPGATLHIHEGAELLVDGTLNITSLGKLIINGKRLIISNTEPDAPTSNTVWIQTFGA